MAHPTTKSSLITSSPRWLILSYGSSLPTHTPVIFYPDTHYLILTPISHSRLNPKQHGSGILNICVLPLAQPSHPTPQAGKNKVANDNLQPTKPIFKRLTTLSTKDGKMTPPSRKQETQLQLTGKKAKFARSMRCEVTRYLRRRQAGVWIDEGVEVKVRREDQVHLALLFS